MLLGNKKTLFTKVQKRILNNSCGNLYQPLPRYPGLYFLLCLSSGSVLSQGLASDRLIVNDEPDASWNLFRNFSSFSALLINPERYEPSCETFPMLSLERSITFRLIIPILLKYSLFCICFGNDGLVFLNAITTADIEPHTLIWYRNF